KVYFTWEGEAGALEEAGVEVDAQTLHREVALNELEVEVRVLERLLADSTKQLTRIHELIGQQKLLKTEGEEL
ncbi:MAG: hypothetical protein ACRDLB_03095, partial [Actinomycetota bacterium]